MAYRAHILNIDVQSQINMLDSATKLDQITAGRQASQQLQNITAEN